MLDRRSFIAGAASALSGIGLRYTPVDEKLFVPRPAFGALVNSNEIASGSAPQQLILRTCRNVVLAGPFYWHFSEGEPGSFDFRESRRLVEFAEAHSLPARCHPLIWHELLPEWVGQLRDPAAMRDAMTRHITGIVSAFRGRVRCWDVVNEALLQEDGRRDGLRSTAFSTSLGEDFIRLAFHSAQAADPGALLGLNEYALENDTARADWRRATMLALLRRLLGDRVPVHYIGIQAHLSSRDRFSEAGLGRFVREVRELGLVVAVTELDVDDSALPTHPLQRDQLVAATYDRFLRVITTAADIDSVNCWGLSDKSSWLQWHKPRTDGMPQRPLPFDADLKPKAAWDVLKRYLDVAP